MKHSILATIALFAGLMASADPLVVNGVDATPLVDFIRGNANTVTKPFKLFHYFQGWGNYLGSYPPEDPRGFEYVKHNAPQFLKHLEKENVNIFGPGFYAATDPIQSARYGLDKNWQLIELEIPAGFRFVSLLNLNSVIIPAEAEKVLKGLQCQINYHSLAWLFSFSFYRYQNYSECANNMREVFRQAQIDGFNYAWSTANTPDCKQEHESAFVIMSDQWLKPELVHIFNAQTTDNKEERIKIAGIQAPFASSLKVLLTFFPLWSDLKDQQSDPDLQLWTKQNLFGCGDQPQYTAPRLTQ